MLDLAKSVDTSGLDVLKDDLGGAEEGGVDRVEVVVIPCEDRGESLSVIPGRVGGNLRPDRFEAGVVARHVKDYPGTIEDRVVGPTDRGDVALGDGRERGDSVRGDDPSEVEFQPVKLM